MWPTWKFDKYKNSSLKPKDSFYFYYDTDKNHSNFIKTTFLRLKKGLNSNAHNCSGRGNFCHKVLSFVLVHAMLAFSFSRLGHQSFTIMIKISFMGKFFLWSHLTCVREDNTFKIFIKSIIIYLSVILRLGMLNLHSLRKCYRHT